MSDEIIMSHVQWVYCDATPLNRDFDGERDREKERFAWLTKKNSVDDNNNFNGETN